MAESKTPKDDDSFNEGWVPARDTFRRDIGPPGEKHVWNVEDTLKAPLPLPDPDPPPSDSKK